MILLNDQYNLEIGKTYVGYWRVIGGKHCMFFKILNVYNDKPDNYEVSLLQYIHGKLSLSSWNDTEIQVWRLQYRYEFNLLIYELTDSEILDIISEVI